MNVFASLEEVLSPGGDAKSPSIGLVVEDWDENLTGVVGQIVSLGRNVQLLPANTLSMEDEPNGIIENEPVIPGHAGSTLFYYKGVPKDMAEGIPILIIDDAKVKVSHEGRVKELAEYLGLLDDDKIDDVSVMTDHEYRD